MGLWVVHSNKSVSHRFDSGTSRLFRPTPIVPANADFPANVIRFRMDGGFATQFGVANERSGFVARIPTPRNDSAMKSNLRGKADGWVELAETIRKPVPPAIA